MMQALRSQHESLKQADSQMQLTNQYAQVIAKLSEEVAQLLEYSEQDIRRSHQNYNYHLDKDSAAQEKFSEILNLVDQANNLN